MEEGKKKKRDIKKTHSKMLDLITSVIMLNVNGLINTPSKGQKLSNKKEDTTIVTLKEKTLQI